ncbi:MAG: TolC family protein [Prolixibacteraceae bacterium]
MNYNLLLQFSCAALLFFSVSGKSFGQKNQIDSLELTPLISKVIETYPTIQQAAEALNAADLKIAMARTAYLPNAQFSGSYAHVGPVPSLTIPDVGSFSLSPTNILNSGVNINETISDFGKTKKSIAYEEKSKELSALGIGQVKQKMALAVIGCYYSMLYFQEAIAIKDNQLLTLQEHLKNVEKKVATGSATQFEILSTKVRISTVESQRTDIVTSLNYQNSYLNMLLGEQFSTVHRVKNLLRSEVIPLSEDSLIATALSNRNELKIALKKMNLSQAYQDMVKQNKNPVLGAFASGGWKNGYIPKLDQLRANYAVGLNLIIPIYDATRTNLNTQLAGSAIRSNGYEIDLTRRTITNEVMESTNALRAAISKSELFDMQLSQAKKALELADLKFKAGTLTNLDLLDSENAVAESSLLFLKARMERVVVIWKLKATLGINLY